MEEEPPPPWSHAVQRANQALDYVHRIDTSPCTGGTEETLLLDFNHTAWAYLTDTATRTANILNKIMARHNNSLKSLSDELFFSLVLNNVHSHHLIFGSGIAIAPETYHYEKFCAYAYKKNGTVQAHDISINYNYHINTTEWWYGPKALDFSNITIVNDRVMYRQDAHSLPEVVEQQPLVDLESGYWTKPYFDCGGGDVWMVTYLAPLLGLNPEHKEVFFQGIASIDIELTHIDINQCDPDDTRGGAIDVFRGTHHCLPSTKCVTLQGEGFHRGTYKCVCDKGFYFPVTDSSHHHYLGYEIEDVYNADREKYSASFLCLPCAPGCDTCVDDTPCLYEWHMATRVIVLMLTFLTIFGILSVSMKTFLNRHNTAIKSASPVFLQLMCLGGLSMCCQLFVAFPEPDDISCAVEGWPFHLGFVLMYGALVMKTWRISVIFRVGKVRKVNLPDQALLHRMIPLMGVAVGYLAAWTAASPPHVIVARTSSDLKYPVCSEAWWSYAAQGAEVVLLLFGCYLCFTVRKAPPHFNESKKIAWSVYNAIILGCFILVLKVFIGSSSGPDVLFVLLFLKVQAYVTITLIFIFAPKFWAVYKKIDPHRLEEDVATQNTNITATGRSKTMPASAILDRLSKHQTEIRASQTSPELLEIYVKYLHGAAVAKELHFGGSSKVAPMPSPSHYFSND
ncbi:hypothetical protein ScPMuIL_014378 [Solemya velum]